LYIDLTAFWQTGNDFLTAFWQTGTTFLNSNFFITIASSCAGAFFGAWGAQRIAARGKERDELLTEIRNTNATTMVAVGMCNSFLGIKRQTVKPLKDLYDVQKAAYDDHSQKFVADLRSFFLPPFPIEILREQMFEKLSLSGRPLLLINALSETVHGVNTSIDNRNKLIEHYKTSRISPDNLVSLYFGLPQASSHVINQEYPASIEQIYRHTDDGIFFSHMLSFDLFDHGKQLAQRFKQRFGKDAPAVLNKPDFTDAAALMPEVGNYVDWFNVVKKAEPSAKTAGRSRRSVLKILSPSFLYNYVRRRK
jgi:hypothetical protein